MIAITKFRQAFAQTSFVLTLLMVYAGVLEAAQIKVNICNDTDDTIYASYAYVSDDASSAGLWISRGWIPLARNGCSMEKIADATLSSGGKAEVFVYAEGDFYRAEQGTTAFCVGPRFVAGTVGDFRVLNADQVSCSNRVYMQQVSAVDLHFPREIRFKQLSDTTCLLGEKDYGDGVCRPDQETRNKTNIRGSIETVSFKYNFFGQLAYLETARGADIVRQTRYVFNPAGQRVEEHVYDATGRLSARRSYEYSANGPDRLVSEASDYDNDGDTDQQTTYHYDSAGNLETESVDSNADGVVDYEVSWTYNSDGLADTEVMASASSSVVFYRTTFTYFESGQLRQTIVDYYGDGEIDESKTWSYYADGRIERVQRDAGYDGSIDYITVYTYDSTGRIDREEQQDGVGQILATREYQYEELERFY